MALGLEKWPTAHTVHSVAGLESRSAVPAAHSPHTTDPSPEYRPVEHAVHFVDASESRSALPAAHSVQVVAADALSASVTEPAEDAALAAPRGAHHHRKPAERHRLRTHLQERDHT